MKNKRRNILPVLLAVAALSLAACGTSASAGDGTEALPQETEEVADTMEVHFLDVGEGDCTLVTCGSEAMLVDGGGSKTAKKVRKYLNSLGITELKYVIATHPDSGHVGGLDTVLKKFAVGTLLSPDIESDAKTWTELFAAADASGCNQEIPLDGESYELGGAKFTVLSPMYNYEDENDSSIVIRLVFGETSFLFMGDASSGEVEYDLVDAGVDVDVDVLKCGRHGSSSSSSEEFLEAVSPDYAVISCGSGNDYGHPNDDTLERLQAAGVCLYRTDVQGTVVAYSDGVDITWSVEPTDDWTAGE